MPRLANPRYERFAQELAIGKSATESYVTAGFKNNRHNAAALARTQHISTRVAEIMAGEATIRTKGLERAIERTAISKERVLTELAKIGFSNMLDYMQVGPDGDPVLNFAALTRDQAAALVEVTVEDFKDGRGDDARDVRRVKFKLADKRSALVDIGKEIGMFIDRKHITRSSSFAEMDFDQLLAIAQGRAPAPQIEHSTTDVSSVEPDDQDPQKP
jgi:phage terminase small subunit